MNETLNAGLKKLGLDFSSSQKEQLEQYASCIIEFNKSYNLMKAETEDALFAGHILDSLAAAEHIKSLIETIQAEKNVSRLEIGDIGSGGGCPGIPLAAAFPEQQFTLVERMEKRCAFLSSTVEKLHLSNVTVACAQADAIKENSFDIEVFRAFHPFDKKNTRLLLRMLKKGGFLAAYKARSEKIEAEMQAVSFLIPSYKKIQLHVPFLEDHERNLVVIRKC